MFEGAPAPDLARATNLTLDMVHRALFSGRALGLIPEEG
jgi:hypothetical protein